MTTFLNWLRVFASGVMGLILGGLAGFFGLFAFAQAYVAMGGDETAAAAMSFFTMLTIPAGVTIGAIAGVIIAIVRVRKLSAKQSSRCVS